MERRYRCNVSSVGHVFWPSVPPAICGCCCWCYPRLDQIDWKKRKATRGGFAHRNARLLLLHSFAVGLVAPLNHEWRPPILGHFSGHPSPHSSGSSVLWVFLEQKGTRLRDRIFEFRQFEFRANLRRDKRRFACLGFQLWSRSHETVGMAPLSKPMKAGIPALWQGLLFAISTISPVLAQQNPNASALSWAPSGSW